MLERRSFVGGCCVTEEFAPGYRASTGAYVLSMLRQAIWHDMRLAQRGLTVSPAGPSLNLFPDGARFTLYDDLGETEREVARFSKHDARRFLAFEQKLADLASIVMPMFEWTPPTTSQSFAELVTTAKMGRKMLGGRRDIFDLQFLFSTSATQYPRHLVRVRQSRGRSAGTRSTTASPGPRRRGRHTCCFTTTPRRSPAAASAPGASSAVAWAK